MTRFYTRLGVGLCLFILLCLVQHRVGHSNARGAWRSTTGEIYRVSADGSRLFIIETGGTLSIRRASWVVEGQSFTFRDVEGQGFAAYRPGHDALEIRGVRGTSWLRRSPADGVSSERVPQLHPARAEHLLRRGR